MEYDLEFGRSKPSIRKYHLKLEYVLEGTILSGKNGNSFVNERFLNVRADKRDTGGCPWSTLVPRKRLRMIVSVF